ncbi:DUF4238 domain-containing protein [Mesorhizobium sp. M0040]|uniref:DUF4238 domain-containing protein n=1 Tax=Mesorhizobium sp. M0040 TaxID=2956855 RepID=UPI003334FFA2
MALDHYVSQVHLRNFYSDDARGRLVAVRKDDLKRFYPWSEDVCRIEDGSTNAYLNEPRAIEAFLKRIEPNYNRALAAVRERRIDAEDVNVVAGFVAYVASCSPAAMRLHSAPITASTEAGMQILDAQGLMPPAPKELGERSMSELLADGAVTINIDGKYPQAIGISQIEQRVHVFGNALWDVMRADPGDGAFLTSDFPIALGASYDNRVVSKTVTLAPDLAICIHPQLSERSREPDFTFPSFRARFRRLKPSGIRAVNRELVRSAENLVFASRDEPWLTRFVRRHRDFRADAVISTLPMPNGGSMIVARQAIVPFARPATVYGLAR